MRPLVDEPPRVEECPAKRPRNQHLGEECLRSALARRHRGFQANSFHLPLASKTHIIYTVITRLIHGF